MRPIILFVALCLLSACGSTDAEDTNLRAPGGNADADAGVGADVAEGRFELGHNEVNQNTPESFTTLEDGASVPVVWGVQGSWMVVLGFRSQDLVEGTFDVRAAITIDGQDSGEVWYELQETFPGGNGWDYYYNLFLPIDQNDAPPVGTPATIRMSVEDEAGNTAEASHDVLIGETIGAP